MRKQIVPAARQQEAPDPPWLNLEHLAQVELTSEDPAHPVEWHVGQFDQSRLAGRALPTLAFVELGSPGLSGPEAVEEQIGSNPNSVVEKPSLVTNVIGDDLFRTQSLGPQRNSCSRHSRWKRWC